MRKYANLWFRMSQCFKERAGLPNPLGSCASCAIVPPLGGVGIHPRAGGGGGRSLHKEAWVKQKPITREFSDCRLKADLVELKIGFIERVTGAIIASAAVIATLANQP